VAAKEWKKAYKRERRSPLEEQYSVGEDWPGARPMEKRAASNLKRFRIPFQKHEDRERQGPVLSAEKPAGKHKQGEGLYPL